MPSENRPPDGLVPIRSFKLSLEFCSPDICSGGFMLSLSAVLPTGLIHGPVSLLPVLFWEAYMP